MCIRDRYNTLDLIDIQYKMFGDWKSIPSVMQNNKSVIEYKTDITGNTTSSYYIPSIGNIKVIFKDITATEIRVILRQKNYIQDGDSRIFYVGARNIEVLSLKYNKETASFYSKVLFKEKDNKIIYGIKSILDNKGDVGDNTVQYEFFALDQYDNPMKISDGFPFEITNEKLLIKYTIYRNAVTPVLSKVQIMYRPK